MNEQFNWYRFGLLVRNDLVRDFRDYLIVFAVFFIIMVLNAIPAAAFGYLREDFYYGLFGGLMLIGGSICNSLQFTELHDKKRNDVWLLLPASALEKTLSRYLNGTVLYILHILVFVTLSSLLIEGFNTLVFWRSNSLFNPLSSEALGAIAAFMIIQPVFFVGGVWFRKLRWFKTVITIWAFLATLALFGCLVALVVFGGHFSEVRDAFVNLDVDYELTFRTFDWLSTIFMFVWYVLVPVFVCYIAWLRVRETQVSYGV